MNQLAEKKAHEIKFSQVEMLQVYEIADTSEDVDEKERLLCAKFLYEQAENKVVQVIAYRDRRKLKYLELEHSRAVQRNENNLIQEATAKYKPDELLAALKYLAGKKGL